MTARRRGRPGHLALRCGVALARWLARARTLRAGGRATPWPTVLDPHLVPFASGLSFIVGLVATIEAGAVLGWAALPLLPVAWAVTFGVVVGVVKAYELLLLDVPLEAAARLVGDPLRLERRLLLAQDRPPEAGEVTLAGDAAEGGLALAANGEGRLSTPEP